MQLLPLGTQAALIYNTISRLPSSYNRYVYKQEMFQGKAVCAILNPVIKTGLPSTTRELKKKDFLYPVLKTFVNLPFACSECYEWEFADRMAGIGFLRELSLLIFLLAAEVRADLCNTNGFPNRLKPVFDLKIF